MPISSQYLVVKFLVLPYEDIDRYVCVPETWQRWQDPDGEVAIAYPEEKPEDTSIKSLNYEEVSKRWKIYMAKICYKADSYMDALNFIISLVENKSEDIIDTLQNMKIENSVKDLNQNTSSTPKSNSIKKKTKNTPSTPAPIMVTKDTEEMTPSSSTPTLIKKDNEEITSITSTPKIVKKKIEKNKPSPSSANAKNNANEETNNHDTGKEKTEVNITPQNKTKKSPYKIPEDFNPKDLKHMFKHSSSILGEVVELLPNTGVFIEVNVLETKFKNYSDMAEGLMKGIFTNKALRNCTMSGEPPIAKNHSDSDTRPALDQDAREAIINYVYDNCYKHWKEGRNSIEHAMRKVLAKSRSKQ